MRKELGDGKGRIKMEKREGVNDSPQILSWLRACYCYEIDRTPEFI